MSRRNEWHNAGNEWLIGTDGSDTTTSTATSRASSPSQDLTTHTWNIENHLIRVDLPMADRVTHLYNEEQIRADSDFFLSMSGRLDCPDVMPVNR